MEASSWGTHNNPGFDEDGGEGGHRRRGSRSRRRGGSKSRRKRDKDRRESDEDDSFSDSDDSGGGRSSKRRGSKSRRGSKGRKGSRRRSRSRSSSGSSSRSRGGGGSFDAARRNIGAMAGGPGGRPGQAREADVGPIGGFLWLSALGLAGACTFVSLVNVDPLISALPDGALAPGNIFDPPPSNAEGVNNAAFLLIFSHFMVGIMGMIAFFGEIGCGACANDYGAVTSYSGRGFYYLVMGMMTLPLGGWLGYQIGFVTVCLGGIHLLYAVVTPDNDRWENGFETAQENYYRRAPANPQWTGRTYQAANKFGNRISRFGNNARQTFMGYWN